MHWRTGRDPLDGAPWTRLEEGQIPAPARVGALASRQSVIYSSSAGYRPLELDLYAADDPTDSSLRPLIVWVHGGAFAMGSKRLLPDFLAQADFFARLARAGFIVAAIDYRLSEEAVWPAQIIDVRAAIRWLHTHSAELGIDPDAIAVWGESAGGNLAAMAGVLGDKNVEGETPGQTSAAVSAVVDWYGPIDFAAMDAQAGANSAMSHDDPESPESRLLGAPVQDVPHLVHAANPASYARAGLPPMLIRHGRDDRLVPFAQSEILADALTRAGSPVRFLPVDNAGHVFDGHPEPSIFLDEAIAFLREVLTRTERVTDDQQ